MAIYDDYDPAYDEPDLEEAPRRKRRSQRYQWEEDQTLADYIAATPKGERRFTNIPGQGEDTFFMPEAPMQAPVGMESRAAYGDPYAETRRRTEALESEGRPVDTEGIYTGVRDEFSRRDEGIQNEMGLRQAMLLKHGPPKAPAREDIMGGVSKLVEVGALTPDEGRRIVMERFGVTETDQDGMLTPEEMALMQEEKEDEEKRTAGLTKVRGRVAKREAKQKARTRSKSFNTPDYGGRNLPQAPNLMPRFLRDWLSRLSETQRRRGFNSPHGLDMDMD